MRTEILHDDSTLGSEIQFSSVSVTARNRFNVYYYFSVKFSVSFQTDNHYLPAYFSV